MNDDFSLDGGTSAAVDLAEIETAEQRAKEGSENGLVLSLANADRHKAGDKQPLYFDLETAPDWPRVDQFDLPPVAEAPPETRLNDCYNPGQVLDQPIAKIQQAMELINPPEEYLEDLWAAEQAGKCREGVKKVIDSIRSKKAAARNAKADRIKLLSTTPEYCRIVALSVAVGDGAPQALVCDENEPSRKWEADLLAQFWDLARWCDPLVGYNIVGFDIPVILFRSALLGVPSTRRINLQWSSNEVIDLYYRRFGPRGSSGGGRPGKLKQLLRLAGISVRAGGTDGSEVYEMLATEEGRRRLWVYACSDVEGTRDLFKFYQGYFV